MYVKLICRTTYELTEYTTTTWVQFSTTCVAVDSSLTTHSTVGTLKKDRTVAILSCYWPKAIEKALKAIDLVESAEKAVDLRDLETEKSALPFTFVQERIR